MELNKTYKPAISPKIISLMMAVFILLPLLMIVVVVLSINLDFSKLFDYSNKSSKILLEIIIIYSIFLTSMLIIVRLINSSRLQLSEKGIKKTFNIFLFDKNKIIPWQSIKRVRVNHMNRQITIFSSERKLPFIISIRAWVEEGLAKKSSFKFNPFNKLEDYQLYQQIITNIPETVFKRDIKDFVKLGSIVKVIAYISIVFTVLFIFLMFNGGEILINNDYFWLPFTVVGITTFFIVLVILKNNFKSAEHFTGNLLVALLFSTTFAFLIGGLHDNISKHMGAKENVILTLDNIENGFMNWSVKGKDWQPLKLKTIKDFEKDIPLNTQITIVARIGFFNYAQISFSDFDEALDEFNIVTSEN